MYSNKLQEVIEQYEVEYEDLVGKDMNDKDLILHQLKNPETLNTFHGTSAIEPEVLLSSDKGFDPNYNHEGFFGPGIYLAENADYSHYSNDKRFSHCVEENKNKYKMIMARAITGVTKRLKQDEDYEFKPRDIVCSNRDNYVPVETEDNFSKEYIKEMKKKHGRDYWSIMWRLSDSAKVLPEYLITYKQLKLSKEHEGTEQSPVPSLIDSDEEMEIVNEKDASLNLELEEPKEETKQ
mmetsp:Transcript_23446/g.20832  ORF Transcript_23446/g.20832 Transcript_23446/m.20832 type:complete len:237 (+) Transcript_23446:867-1577(+)